MTRSTRLLIALLALTAGATAHAGHPYVGGKVGIMDVDLAAYDSATTVGLLVGWETRMDGPVSVGVEGEITTTLGDADFSSGGVTAEWNLDTYAAYGVARFGDQVYGKAKLGVLHEDLEVTTATASVRGDDTGASMGLGVGLRVNRSVSIEGEYTLIEEDVDFWSAGVNLAF